MIVAYSLLENKFCDSRLAIAAYGLRCWDNALDHFQTLLEKFPTKPGVFERLTQTLERIKESKRGVYDIERLYNEAFVEKRRQIDRADYLGPISLVDTNNGKGYIASKYIVKGTLLLAEKAFSSAYGDEFKGTLVFGNTTMDNFNLEKLSKFLLIQEVINNLRYNPSKSVDLYSLYAGTGFSRLNVEQLPEGFKFLLSCN